MVSIKRKKTGTILLAMIILSTSSLGVNIKAIGTAAAGSGSAGTSTVAVVVKRNELNLVNLNNNSISKLDDGGVFSRPKISLNRTNIAYLKNNALYIVNTSGKKLKVHDDICMECYAWLSDSSLIYSPNTGGMYVFSVEKNESKPYIQNEFNYQNITLGSNKKMYAEKYLNYTKEGIQYISDYGVVLINQDTKREELIIKSVPQNPVDMDLGMYPIIAGISKDLRFLYIFEHPHSASMAADGVGFASYDTKLGKYISYKNITTLAYRDNISSSSVIENKIAIVSGGGREMKYNKTLGLLNLINEHFETMSAKDQAAMTPCFSADGNTILYAASKQGTASEGTNEWMKKGNHNIYSVDIRTRKITQLTTSGKSFDFSPICINNNIFVFFRSNLKDNISMWKLEGGKEVPILDGLVLSTDMQYPVLDYYGHFDTYNFVDVK